MIIAYNCKVLVIYEIRHLKKLNIQETQSDDENKILPIIFIASAILGSLNLGYI